MEFKKEPTKEEQKLSDELKAYVDKLFDALEKKQKILEFEDKILDKFEGLLSKAAPHIFWNSEEEGMDSEGSDEDIMVINDKVIDEKDWTPKKKRYKF